jgi:hypothetical protein
MLYENNISNQAVRNLKVVYMRLAKVRLMKENNKPKMP